MLKVPIPIAALMGTTALVGVAVAQEQQGGQPAPGTEVAECQELQAFVQENDLSQTGMTEERAQRVIETSDPQYCQDALRVATGEISEEEGAANFDADARARLLVAVPEPEVSVTQAAPEVTVEQQEPQVRVEPGQPLVTVNQAEPVVRVELAPPTITIDMPKPQILVEMPDPNVEVSTPQPRVSVRQPEPQVQVEQGEVQVQMDEQTVAQGEAPTEEGNVTVAQDEPTVAFEEAEGANVQVGEVRPAVRYHAAEPRIEVAEAGEPQIQFNQPGEADVQIRQLSAEETRQLAERQGEQPDEQRHAAAVQPREQEEQQATAEQAADDASIALVGVSVEDDPAAGAEAQTERLSVEQLMDTQVFGANGEELGDIEDIVLRGDETYVIVGHGGFLGLGEKQVALPMEDMRWVGDQLVMREITAEEVEQMEEVSASDFQAYEPGSEVEVITE